MRRLEPVAELKFKVVTVEEPALKAPVKARFDPVAETKVRYVPVALVKLMVAMVPVVAVRPAVRLRFEPVAPLKVTVFKLERPLMA